MNANLREREVTLMLTDSGGAEVIDNKSGNTLWASDSDDDFREEFPDVLSQADIEGVLDYLCARDVLTDDEADEADILMESPSPDGDGPGDEDEDDDEDEFTDDPDEDEEE